MITFTLETITPEVASVYLTKNDPKNRRIRPGTIQDYAKSMAEGSWQLTHQTIAFDAYGKLIDGQHRLMAISRTNRTYQMYVARYDSQQTAMQLSIDRNARRSFADILNHDRKLVDIATALNAIRGSYGVSTVAEIEAIVQKITPMAVLLNDTCPTSVRVRSTATIRAAVICQMMAHTHMAESIAENYRAFVLLDFDACSQSIKVFLKTLDNLSMRSGSDRTQVFARSLKAFDPEKFNAKVNRYGNVAEEAAEARAIINAALNDDE